MGGGPYTSGMSGRRFSGVISTDHGRVDLTGRPLVMGVLNVTPDSFSDGGDYFSAEAAAGRAAELVEEGADIIDVGGESTRPGSEPVDAAEQMGRVIPAIEAVRRVSESVPISIDTRLASVARAALDAGADIINDTTALGDDKELAELAARRRVPVVLMHMLGRPATMQQSPRYDDVVERVCSFLRERVAAAVAAGIERRRIIVDPGIGFGKTTEHNLALIRRLDELLELGQPVLLGPSRKRFIGQVLGIDEPKRRQWGTAAVVAYAAMAGVHIVRVHDVPAMRQVVAMCWALRQGT